MSMLVRVFTFCLHVLLQVSMCLNIYNICYKLQQYIIIYNTTALYFILLLYTQSTVRRHEIFVEQKIKIQKYKKKYIFYVYQGQA